MRRCFLLLIDGLRADVAEAELAAGRLPNLGRLTARGGVGRAITSFPSTTSVSYLPFVTRHPPPRAPHPPRPTPLPAPPPPSSPAAPRAAATSPRSAGWTARGTTAAGGGAAARCGATAATRPACSTGASPPARGACLRWGR